MSIGSLERVVGSQGPNSMFREPSGLFRPAILLIFVSSREKIPLHARLPEPKESLRVKLVYDDQTLTVLEPICSVL